MTFGKSTVQDLAGAIPPRKHLGQKRRRSHDYDSLPDGSRREMEDQHDGPPAKRRSASELAGERFACPYYRQHPGKYFTGECNRTGFKDIYRLKTHLRKHHMRAGFQRCHICQHWFGHDRIVNHEPCERRDRPTDAEFEEGFDAAQADKLNSKELCPRTSSQKDCWREIFRVLFPYKSESASHIDPYQGNPEAARVRHEIRRFYQALTSQELIDDLSLLLSGNEIRHRLQRVFVDLGVQVDEPPASETANQSQDASQRSRQSNEHHFGFVSAPGAVTIPPSSLPFDPLATHPGNFVSNSLETFTFNQSICPPFELGYQPNLNNSFMAPWKEDSLSSAWGSASYPNETLGLLGNGSSSADHHDSAVRSPGTTETPGSSGDPSIGRSTAFRVP